MPIIRDDLRCYWDAYHDLTSSRQIGMDIAAIPVSEITAYLDFIGLTDDDDRMDYLKIIQGIDAEYLEHHAETRKREQQKAKGKKPSRR